METQAPSGLGSIWAEPSASLSFSFLRQKKKKKGCGKNNYHIGLIVSEAFETMNPLREEGAMQSPPDDGSVAQRLSSPPRHRPPVSHGWDSSPALSAPGSVSLTAGLPWLVLLPGLSVHGRHTCHVVGIEPAALGFPLTGSGARKCKVEAWPCHEDLRSRSQGFYGPIVTRLALASSIPSALPPEPLPLRLIPRPLQCGGEQL